MGVKVTNNGYGTLSAGIAAGDTTITLDGGQGARFPALGAGDYFYGTLVDTANNIEVVKVTARSSDSMTVVRGQDNTVAKAYSIGDRFELRPTAALFNDLQTAIDNVDLSSRVAKTGDTMTGTLHLSIPSGRQLNAANWADVGGADGGQASFSSGAYLDKSSSQFKYTASHASIGAIGVRLNSPAWNEGSLFTSGTTSSVAGQAFTPIDALKWDSTGRVITPYKPWILCKVYRASASSGYYSLDAKASRYLSVGTYGGNHAILAPVAGVYAINFNGITSSTSGRVDLNLYKNGGLLLSSLNEANGDGYHYRSIASTQYLNAGDAIQMFHASSVSPYYSGAGGSDLEWCNLSMTLLG